MGWLHRSNFKASNEGDQDCLVKQQIARKLASLVLDSETVLYQQWLKGEHNIIADRLSRDCYFIHYDAHQSFLSSICPSQLPGNFYIKAVPKEICCFIISMLQQLPVKKQQLFPTSPRKLAVENVGMLSSSVLASIIPHILKECQHCIFPSS